MKGFRENPKVKVARRAFKIAWIFYSLYLAFLMLFSYTLGIKPLIFGLPLWVAVGCVITPAFFVLSLIFVAEKLIPDISLTDEGDERLEEDKK